MIYFDEVSETAIALSDMMHQVSMPELQALHVQSGDPRPIKTWAREWWLEWLDPNWEVLRLLGEDHPNVVLGRLRRQEHMRHATHEIDPELGSVYEGFVCASDCPACNRFYCSKCNPGGSGR